MRHAEHIAHNVCDLLISITNLLQLYFLLKEYTQVFGKDSCQGTLEQHIELYNKKSLGKNTDN